MESKNFISSLYLPTVNEALLLHLLYLQAKQPLGELDSGSPPGHIEADFVNCLLHRDECGTVK